MWQIRFLIFNHFFFYLGPPVTASSKVQIINVTNVTNIINVTNNFMQVTNVTSQLQCEFCDRTFTTKEILKRHIQTVHEEWCWCTLAILQTNCILWLTASFYERQWGKGMPKSHNTYFIVLSCLDGLSKYYEKYFWHLQQ